MNFVTQCVAFPDGSKVVSSSDDFTLRVWDCSLKTAVPEQSGHSDIVADCCFSPDGKRIASASQDKTVKLWDGASGIELITIAAAENIWGTTACNFSPDGERLVSASNDETLRIWDARTGVLLASLASPPNSLYTGAFSPDGRRLISRASEGLILWNMDKGTRVANIDGRWLTDSPFSADGKYLVSGSSSRDSELMLWDGATGSKKATLEARLAGATVCAWSFDARTIVSGHADGTLALWNAESIDGPKRLGAHARKITACSFSPDSTQVISGSVDGTITLWDVTTGSELANLTNNSASEIRFCGFSPCGNLICCVSANGILTIWNAASGELLTEFLSAFQKVAWSAGGSRIISTVLRGVVPLLRPQNVHIGPPVVTAWRPRPQSFFRRRNEANPAIGCLLCREWSELSSLRLGTEIECAGCGSRLRVNPFTIDADWRPVAKAWRGHA
jgi:WD40 repeat protein